MPTPHGPAEPPTSLTYGSVEPRWFGVAPPMLLLGLAAASLVAAIALFAAGDWPFGLALLGVAAIVAAVLLEAVRRRPSPAVESLAARWSALAETQRVRAARSVLATDRRQALLRLGEAVHREDEAAAAEVRATLAELDRADAELEERLRSTRLSVQETMIRMPEPYPPPDEGTPPTPAPVPEPSPDPRPDEDVHRPAA